MKSDFFVVGSINMDLVATVEYFPHPGETLRGNSFDQHPGGKGANQACALGRLGADVKMVGKLGDDQFAGEYLSHFRRTGVDVSFLQREQHINTGIAVIEVERSGENKIVIIPGANDLVNSSLVEQASGSFGPNSIVLLQLEIPVETVLYTLEKAKAAGATTILDPAPAAELPMELYRLVDIITPNETELKALAGNNLEDSDSDSGPDRDPETEKAAGQAGPGGQAGQAGKSSGKEHENLLWGAETLLSYGVGNVVLKLGSRGSAVLTGGARSSGPGEVGPGNPGSGNGRALTMVKGFEVAAVDTTAAGDSFNAGLAIELGRGKTLVEAARYANAVGALSTLKIGAQSAMPDAEEVQSFLESQS